MSAGDVEDPVDVGQDRVDLMGDEEDRGLAGPALLVQQAGHEPLMGHIEVQQRLIAQQQVRVRAESLGDAQALQFATGEHADRGVGVGLGTDLFEQRFDLLAARAGEPARSPAVAVESHAHEVAAAHRGVVVDAALLGDVADVRVSASGAVAVDAGRTGIQLILSEEDLEQGGLAAAVGAEDGDELAGLDVDVEVVPQHPVPETQLCVAELEDRVGAVWSRISDRDLPALPGRP